MRVGLIRATEHHADRHPARRTLLVARTDPGATWLSSRWVTDLDELRHLDVRACLSSTTPPDTLPGVHDPSVEAALLVCTNARRDRCCALLGRPLAAELAAHPDAGTAVWETSHLSGHRFAPTFLSLPDGYLYGGPDAAERTLDSCRGRSSLPAAAQVAELAVLRHLGVPRSVSPGRPTPSKAGAGRSPPTAVASWWRWWPTRSTASSRAARRPWRHTSWSRRSV